MIKKKNNPPCSFCHSKEVVGNGLYKQWKRYRCKNCKKSYNDFTGTAFSYIHDKKKFNLFSEKLMMEKSIRQLAEEVNMSPNTSFQWRRKILTALKHSHI